MHRITQVRANSDFSLDLGFDDGKHAHLDISELVKSAPVAAAFRDSKRFVPRVTLVEDGDVLRWDNQFELHADSLWYRAFPEELIGDYGPVNQGRPAA